MRYLLPAVLGALSLIFVDGVAAQDTPGSTDVQVQAFLAGNFCQGKDPNV